MSLWALTRGTSTAIVFAVFMRTFAMGSLCILLSTGRKCFRTTSCDDSSAKELIAKSGVNRCK